ncbi:CLUMA_CG014257, isoform A [Clunio marinus]|uniref:CLUMA_CG014257, isoform A n=1 Tax=Clunio marinus TaxID=568069 RepID=A0A1J1ILM7_9DIPT|nr:CLUMA_CG014257, isoform A [Clunio marinus]
MHSKFKLYSIFNGIIHIILLLNILMYFNNGLAQMQSTEKAEKNAIDKHAVEGRRVSLPCPLSAPSRDKVYMVLWFKNDVKIPMYSFDVRGKPLQQARHWSAPEIFGSRAKFNADTDPATLDIEDIRRHDEGIYRCRVDFRTSQTQSFRYNLTVIILPEYPVVLNRRGRPLNGTVLGPKEEGDDVLLTCRVVGGRPTPMVRWLVNGLIVDEQVEQSTGDLNENRLMWPSVQRSDLNSIFTCQAINTQLVEPRESSFVLDLHLKPLQVKILNPMTPLVADRRYEVSCESRGSRPNAIITWYKGKRQLRRTKLITPQMLSLQEEVLTNITKSVLNFVPTTEDDGKSITCRAENPKIPGQSALETTWKIEVIYPPLVTLRLGSTLIVDDIKESDDIYFECDIKANPPWRKLSWLHDGIVISHNASARIIRSNQSLVLQRVNKNSSGNYSCSAINAEGETVSNQLPLRVKYAPVCITDKIVIVGAYRSENLNVVCEVHADPPPRSFKWKFNSSGESFELPKERHFKNGSQSSILRYTPIMDQDYGTLTCSGQNEVGEQSIPCIFQVILAGLPSPVRNCSINNQTQHSLDIQCLPGYDGGLPQIFLLELIAVRSGKLRLNLTNVDEPYFVIDALESYTSYDTYGDESLRAVVYSVNQKGRSAATTVREFDFDENGENRAAVMNSAMDLSPILLGILFTLVLLCLVIFIKLYCYRSTSSNINNSHENTKHSNNIKNDGTKFSENQKKNTPQRWQNCDGKSKELRATTDLLEDEKDPDVIPHGKKTEKSLNVIPTTQHHFASTRDDAENEWTDGNVNSYYNQFINQNARLKETTVGLSSLSTESSIVTSTPKSQSIISNSNVESSAATAAANSNPFQQVSRTANGEIQSNQTVDYDFNINAIKTLLMTSKVPESCV